MLSASHKMKDVKHPRSVAVADGVTVRGTTKVSQKPQISALWTKSVWFILLGPRRSEPNSMAIHQNIAAMFQSGPKCWTDWLTDLQSVREINNFIVVITKRTYGRAGLQRRTDPQKLALRCQLELASCHVRGAQVVSHFLRKHMSAEAKSSSISYFHLPRIACTLKGLSASLTYFEYAF